jgi:hypothetical protein
VGRVVVVEVHRNHDAEEAADFGHGMAPRLNTV